MTRHDNVVADWQYDNELEVWLVTLSVAVDAAKASTSRHVIEQALQDVEAILPTLG